MYIDSENVSKTFFHVTSPLTSELTVETSLLLTLNSGFSLSTHFKSGPVVCYGKKKRIMH